MSPFYSLTYHPILFLAFTMNKAEKSINIPLTEIDWISLSS